jgi:hypothetical protein
VEALTATRVEGAAAAVAPYIGAAVAVSHGGSNLPQWPTAVGCPRSQRTVAAPLAAVGHGSCLSIRCGARRLVAKSAKNSSGSIILQNNFKKYKKIHVGKSLPRRYTTRGLGHHKPRATVSNARKARSSNPTRWLGDG